MWSWLMAFLKRAGTTCSTLILYVFRELQAWQKQATLPSLEHMPQDIAQVIRDQRSKGWKQFLEGSISLHWKEYQREYFQNIQSRKGEVLWASKMIRAGWDLIAWVWEGRNKQLHETERIVEMEGKKEMIKAVRQEKAIGLSLLPAYEFSDLFKISDNDIDRKSVEELKAWLTLVKQVRIVHNGIRRVTDDPFMKGALKRALGLVEYNTETGGGKQRKTKKARTRCDGNVANTTT